MAVLELDFKILMCHNNKIENTFNISGEWCDPFCIYFVAVGFFFSAGKPWEGEREPPGPGAAMPPGGEAQSTAVPLGHVLSKEPGRPLHTSLWHQTEFKQKASVKFIWKKKNHP